MARENNIRGARAARLKELGLWKFRIIRHKFVTGNGLTTMVMLMSMSNVNGNKGF